MPTDSVSDRLGAVVFNRDQTTNCRVCAASEATSPIISNDELEGTRGVSGDVHILDICGGLIAISRSERQEGTRIPSRGDDHGSLSRDPREGPGSEQCTDSANCATREQ